MGIGKTGGKKEISSERYRGEEHWDSGDELIIISAGVNYPLGPAVSQGNERRIREVTARFTGTVNIVVSLRVGVNIRLSFDLPAKTTKVWSSEDGRKFLSSEQVNVQASSVVGGTLYVTAAGMEGIQA